MGTILSKLQVNIFGGLSLSVSFFYSIMLQLYGQCIIYDCGDKCCMLRVICMCKVKMLFTSKRKSTDYTSRVSGH
jgi:hypothetical protein